MAKVKQRRQRAVQSRPLSWTDPYAEQARSMIAGWRATRETLANGERQLGDLLDAAIAAYEGRPYPGDLVLQGPGARRFAEWTARCEVLRDAAAAFLDTFGFVEALNTPWVALHHAHAFDDRAPHDSTHCGMCIADAEQDGAAALAGAFSERLRYGPLPPRSLPFVLVERLDLLATYSTPPDQPGSPFAPDVRANIGGLEIHEVFLTSPVRNALEHVGLKSVLEANKVRCKVRLVGHTTEAVEPTNGRDAPGLELAEGVIDVPPGAAGRLRESLRYDLRGEVLRWLVMSGRVPTEEEWSGLADWPAAELITAAYGSFDALIDACALDSSEYLRKARRLEAEGEKTRELNEDAERRLERAAASERELAMANGRADELSRATAEAATLRASVAVLEARSQSLEVDRGALEDRLRDLARRHEIERSELRAAAARADAQAAETRAQAARGPHTISTPASHNQVIVPRGPELGLMLYRLWLPFDVETAGNDLVESAAEWIQRGRPGVKEALLEVGDERVEIQLSGGEKLAAERLIDGEDWLWQAHWRHPYDQDPRVRFSIQATVCERGEERYFGLEIGIVRPGTAMRPLWVPFHTPRLAAEIVTRFASHDGERCLDAEALQLANAADAEQLAGFLLSPERQRPVVHCSARQGDQRFDTDRLARELAGLAHVTSSADPGVDDALKVALPERLDVSGGALRIYYPQLAEDSTDPSEHRCFTAAEIDRAGEDAIRGKLLRTLSQIAAATLTPPAGVVDVRRRGLRTRAHTAALRHQEIEPANVEVLSDEFLADYEQTLSGLDAAREENTQLGTALEDQKTLTDAQTEQISELARQLQIAQVQLEHQIAHLPPAEDDPRTVADAVQRAKDEAHHLIYANSAFESSKDSPYGRPQDILDALRSLDQLAEDYRRPEGIGTKLANRAAALGLDWRGGVSQTAVSKNPDEYTITHQGRELTVGPHVVVGNGHGAGLCSRIYLVQHAGDKRTPRGLIVALVGRHLSDSTT
jgi:hypothetical protein